MEDLTLDDLYENLEVTTDKLNVDPILEQEDPVEEEVKAEEEETSTTPTEEDLEKVKEQVQQEDEDDINYLLRTFGIENKTIQFEDGSTAKFDELSKEERRQYLDTLLDSTQQDFSDDELGLIQAIRETGQPLNEIIESLVQERLSEVAPVSSVDNFSDDEIFVLDYRRKNPEAQDDEITEELEKAKERKLYDKDMEYLRNEFKREEEIAQREREAQLAQERQEQLEQERQEIVTATQEINSLLGANVNEDQKNFIYNKILELDEENDVSVFQKEILSNPEAIFKAAYYYYFADPIINQYKEIMQKEVNKAYAKGRNDVFEKLPSKPLTAKQVPSTNTKDNTDNKNTDEIQSFENFLD